MNVYLIHQGQRHVLKVSNGAPTAEASIACPHCGEKPLRVMGDGMRHGGHDYYKANGFCSIAACGKPVGEIRAYMGTIFGIEEDERVLNGRARVY